MGIIQNKQLRLHGWDYRSSGTYFVTICTYKRVRYFGEVVDGKMNLSPVGIIADILWHQIPFHANMEIGAYAIMPDHIHGILVIPEIQNDNPGNSAGHSPLHRFRNIGKNSLSSIVGSFKSSVSRHAHRLGYELQWHRRFHDHIVRDELSYQRIVEYIVNNPKRWGDR